MRTGGRTWAGVGSIITKQQPDFDFRSYGYGKLSDLMTATTLFDLERRAPGDGKPAVIYIRDKHHSAQGPAGLTIVAGLRIEDSASVIPAGTCCLDASSAMGSDMAAAGEHPFIELRDPATIVRPGCRAPKYRSAGHSVGQVTSWARPHPHRVVRKKFLR